MDHGLTSFDYRRVIDTIRRANAIAANNDLDALRIGTVGGGQEMVLDLAGNVAVNELRETWESGLTVGR